MKARRLRHIFALWITAFVLLLSASLVLTLILGAKRGMDEMRVESVDFLQQTMVETARQELIEITDVLAENLVNPLYQLDMLALQQQLANSRRLPGISETLVFDARGTIVHDGHESLESYGGLIEQPVFEAMKQSRDRARALRIEGDLVSVRALRIGDELLGGVMLRRDLTVALQQARILGDQLSAKSYRLTGQWLWVAAAISLSVIVIAILLTWLMARRLAEPLDGVVQQVLKIGSGQQRENLEGVNTYELNQLVTAINRMSDELADTTVSRDYVERIINAMHDALFVVDQRYVISLSNTAASQLSGYPLEGLERHSFLELIAPHERTIVAAWMESHPRDEGSSMETEWLTASGALIPVMLSISSLERGSQVQVCLVQDISDRKRQEREIRYLAEYDPLTKLPNRSLFFDRLRHAMKTADDEEQLMALLYIDIDFFKKINDGMGHAAGDEVLQQVAQRLLDSIRLGDTVARMGGDEFTVILAGIQRVADVEHAVEKLLHALTPPIRMNDQSVYVSASVGIALYPLASSTPESLVQKADVAMYRAKQEGRASSCFYEANRLEFDNSHLELENQLRLALLRKELAIHYQPIVAVGSGAISGLEALIRWQHPQRGLLLPGEFLEQLEEVGQLRAVGYWMINEICAQIASWKQHPRLGGVRVALNLNAHQLADHDLLDRLSEAMTEYELPAHIIDLEITEGTLLEDRAEGEQFLEIVSTMGLSVTVDDFGTGYSSLSYLHSLPLSALKMDQSFIRDLAGNEDSKVICRAIVAMGHALDMRVVAEGVETTDQLEIVRALGVDEVQGYFFHKPMSPGELESMDA